MEGYDGLAPEAPSNTDDTIGADCAPFDRVEHLARQMCEDAGGQWTRKGTRRNHWRSRAVDRLAETDAAGLGDVPTWAQLVGAGALVLGGIVGLVAMLAGWVR